MACPPAGGAAPTGRSSSTPSVGSGGASDGTTETAPGCPGTVSDGIARPGQSGGLSGRVLVEVRFVTEIVGS